MSKSREPKHQDPPLTLVQEHKSYRFFDSLVVVAVFVVAFILGGYFDLFERWEDFVQNHEEWELDELTVAVFATALAMIWYAWRRQKETERARILAIESEKMAETANRAKSDFLASMSHDLRTPLTAISGFADVMSEEVFGPLGSQKYNEYANDIRSSSKQLQALIDDILDLSEIEAGSRSLVMESLDIGALTRNCSTIIAEAANQKGVEYSIDVSGDIPPVMADNLSMNKILLNVLSNAVKFTEPPGRISLTVTVSGDHHIFVARDTGKGIPEEMMPFITDRFVRMQSDPHVSQSGSGIGLSIVKSLVELHRGELDIKSELGAGTVVTVRLPSRAS